MQVTYACFRKSCGERMSLEAESDTLRELWNNLPGVSDKVLVSHADSVIMYMVRGWGCHKQSAKVHAARRDTRVYSIDNRNERSQMLGAGKDRTDTSRRSGCPRI